MDTFYVMLHLLLNLESKGVHLRFRNHVTKHDQDPLGVVLKKAFEFIWKFPRCNELCF